MVENNMQPARKDLSTRTGTKVMGLIDSVGSVQIKTHLGKLLEERRLTQAEISEITGIGKNMISGFVNNKEGVKVGYSHIYALMIALRLTDISELIYVEYDEETAEKFDSQRADWLDTKVPPAEIRNLFY